MPFARQLDFEGGPKSYFWTEANKMRKSGVLDRVLKKQEFQWIFDARIQGPDLVKTRLVGDLLQFKRFGWLRILMKNGRPNGTKKSSKSRTPMVEFFETV